MGSWEMIVKLVNEFYIAFDQEKYIGVGELPYDRKKLRQKLLIEEYIEYRKARNEKNLVEVLDAVVDMYYVYIGTLLEKLGDISEVRDYIFLEKDRICEKLWSYIEKYDFIDEFVEAFQEIHCSNMSKLGKAGKPVYRSDGKITKGPNYFRPNLKKFVGNREWKY